MPATARRRRAFVEAPGWPGAKLSARARTGAHGFAVAADLGVREMNGFPWLTVITLTPLLGGLMVIGMSAQRGKLARGLALVISFVALALAVLVWTNFDSTSTELQFVERYPWVPSLGI